MDCDDVKFADIIQCTALTLARMAGYHLQPDLAQQTASCRGWVFETILFVLSMENTLFITADVRPLPRRLYPSLYIDSCAPISIGG